MCFHVIFLQVVQLKVVVLTSLYLSSVRPRGGAVSLYSEEAAPAGVFPGQSQRVPADRAQPLSVLLGCRVQGRPRPSHDNSKHYIHKTFSRYLIKVQPYQIINVKT